ncbi:hypothetical protein [Ramlibacter albus]|uniref:Uncharacterized protein n=1 Tax=Ramlibacter albus TaxID=2079448 RepID=A0A923M7Q5_9BURK|nr:hypothetical protein [Ramlibacter albus]MBC5764264.1 hypothetical protein [Ramlibacter albus]
MLRKLITMAATAALGKKAYDAWKNRQTEEERKELEAMAAGIQPQSDSSQVKPARKGGSGRRSKRSDGPSAD